MHGFAAINAQNGWAMAFLGFMIVVSGLAVLAIVIAQLHRVLGYWERRQAETAAPQRTAAGELAAALSGEPENTPAAAPERIPQDIAAAAALYQPLIDQLQQPFELNELYRLANLRGYPHPHLTISALRQNRFLIFQGDGRFRWHRCRS